MYRYGYGYGIQSRSLGIILSASLKAKFLDLWGVSSDGSLYNIIGSDSLTINNKDWSGNYIPYDSSATFNIPNEAAFINADADDNLWYNGSIQDVTVSNLIGVDWTRTFVKYANNSPYNITLIGILKAGETLTDADKNQLSSYFSLYFLYFGIWNDNGYAKQNR